MTWFSFFHVYGLCNLRPGPGESPFRSDSANVQVGQSTTLRDVPVSDVEHLQVSFK